MTRREKNEFSDKLDKIMRKVSKEPLALKYLRYIRTVYLDTISISFDVPITYRALYSIFEMAPKQYTHTRKVVSMFDFALRNIAESNIPLKPTVMKTGAVSVVDNRWIFLRFGPRSYAIVRQDDGRLEGRFFGKKCIPDMQKFLSKARSHARAKVYSYSETEHDWNTTAYVGDVGRKNFIIDDKKFNDAMSYINNGIRLGKKLFDERGIIKNPGLLFYGPPGTGKTTFVKYLAAHLGARVYTCSLGEPNGLKALSALDIGSSDSYPHIPYIMLFEDIDVVCSNRDDDDPEIRERFSLLLQTLDGMLSKPGFIKIATTNHIDKVDEALLRGGRFGKHVKMDCLNEEQAKELCDIFHVSHEVLKTVTLPIPAADLEQRLIEEWEEGM